MIDLRDSESRRRAKRLARKFMSTPVLPALGWTKAVESVVAGGELAAWLVYAATVTVVWVALDDVREAAEEVTD